MIRQIESQGPIGTFKINGSIEHKIQSLGIY